MMESAICSMQSLFIYKDFVSLNTPRYGYLLLAPSLFQPVLGQQALLAFSLGHAVCASVAVFCVWLSLLPSVSFSGLSAVSVRHPDEHSSDPVNALAPAFAVQFIRDTL